MLHLSDAVCYLCQTVAGIIMIIFMDISTDTFCPVACMVIMQVFRVSDTIHARICHFHQTVVRIIGISYQSVLCLLLCTVAVAIILI